MECDVLAPVYGREGRSLRTHVHVRKLESWQQQLSLLFRDYFRAHANECCEYERVKISLAEKYSNDRMKYVTGKDPVIWDILRRATGRVLRIGWEAGPSDA
jgi:GrpB-like predicted nucleotidyltransferase (UPF0157 family)